MDIMKMRLKFDFFSGNISGENRHSVLKYVKTSGFWSRVRARALRAPVFLGSLTRRKGRCAPPIAASLLPQK
jgi:hypothetical protein